MPDNRPDDEPDNRLEDGERSDRPDPAQQGWPSPHGQPPGYPQPPYGWFPPAGHGGPYNQPPPPYGWQAPPPYGNQRPPYPPSPAGYAGPQRPTQYTTGQSIAIALKRIAIAAGVLALFGILLNAADGGDSADSRPAARQAGGSVASEPTPEPSTARPSSPAPAAKLGEPVRDGKFEFVVSGMECGIEQIGSEFLNEEAQGQFCIVSLSVRNIGDVPQTFFGSNQYLFNAAGQRFDADTAAGIYLDDSESFIEEINPGKSLSGKVVFDVPPDAAPVSIELHDSIFSGGAVVELK